MNKRSELSALGTSNFGQFMKDKIKFVDKSLFIKDILDFAASVNLITRPRRFGKTLNLSMLHHFLSPSVDNTQTKGLFDTLKIAQAGKQYMDQQGTHPVIFISFKSLKNSTFKEFIENLRLLIQSTYSNFNYLLDDPKQNTTDIEHFKNLMNCSSSISVLKISLTILGRMLKRYHKKDVWILIDEYDTPLQSAYLENELYYKKMILFLRIFLGETLKDSQSLAKAVVTGICRVSKESLFSGINNLTVFGMFDHLLSSHFGFSEEEVLELLDNYSNINKIEEVRLWYNGYNIGNNLVYNPWSIMSYLYKDSTPQGYWVGTAENALLKSLLFYNDNLDIKNDLIELMQNGKITKKISDFIIFSKLKNSSSAIWNLFLMAGYLSIESFKIKGTKHEVVLKIPNLEVLAAYEEIITDWLLPQENGNDLSNFFNFLIKAEIKKAQNILQSILINSTSFYDSAQRPEAFYHGLLIGLITGKSKEYTIASNGESGFGRFDIALIPKQYDKILIIIEIKRAKNNETLSSVAKMAIKQIEKKKYLNNWPEHMNKLKVGMSFNKKQCFIAQKN